VRFEVAVDGEGVRYRQGSVDREVHARHVVLATKAFDTASRAA
jgi:hypothetical protein